MRGRCATLYKVVGLMGVMALVQIPMNAGNEAAAAQARRYVAKPVHQRAPSVSHNVRSGGRHIRPSGGGSRVGGHQTPSNRGHNVNSRPSVHGTTGPSGHTTHGGLSAGPGKLNAGGNVKANPPANVQPYQSHNIQPYQSGNIQPYQSGNIQQHQAQPVPPYNANNIRRQDAHLIKPDPNRRHNVPPNNRKLTNVNGGNFPIVRERRRIYFNGAMRTFVPFGALSVIYFGGRQLYPYGYVATAQPLCTGVSDNGCTLNWQMINFEEGGSAAQCVEYCPQTVSAAPLIALAEAPAAPAGVCDMVIYADPNFNGLSAPTQENQPRLDEIGWKNEIASIEIKSGNWDLYTGDEYQGDAMRLGPGKYSVLAEAWRKRIGSFMCVAPGPAPGRLASAPAAEKPGACEVVLYSEPKLSGTSASTGENQARLDEAGWKNEIASLEVKAGNWEFYADDEFRGESLRLAPGSYGTLAAQWTKRIGSFKCNVASTN